MPPLTRAAAESTVRLCNWWGGNALSFGTWLRIGCMRVEFQAETSQAQRHAEAEKAALEAEHKRMDVAAEALARRMQEPIPRG